MASILFVAAIFLLLAVSAGLVIGITFAPCYATLCTEDYFPLETRLHLTTFYGLLAVTSLFLWLRSSTHFVRTLSRTRLSPHLPILGKCITVGGLAMAVWLIGATGATAAFWTPAQLDFWGKRTDPLNWDSAKIRLTITGVSGHFADILLGLLVIPVSRNSLLGQAFGIHQSTLLSAHKIVAYLFTAATLAHGVAYALYALDGSGDGDAAKEAAFATGNPAMTLKESEVQSSWYTNTTYTGAAALIFLIIIVCTALPCVRRRWYNVFYYCHIITSIAIFAAAIMHASTDLYLLLPGLLLWVFDWGRRLFGGDAGALTKYDTRGYSLSDVEEGTPVGDPLMCYYLNFPAVSKIQNHPFTAVVSGSMTSGPVFLFQRVKGKKSQKRLARQWTWELAAMSNAPGDQGRTLKARVEGPYRPSDRGFETASHIICIVGGTGITGAHSLAVWWIKSRATLDDSKFTLVWTVRHEDMANLREWRELMDMSLSISRLRLITHVSSQSGRVNPAAQIKQALELRRGSEGGRTEKRTPNSRRAAWVYSSGPESLIRCTEKGCIEAQEEIRGTRRRGGSASVDEIDWYMAKWEV